VWDATSGVQVTSTLEHRAAVESATFTSDGTRIVTASDDGSVQVWDASSGNLLTPPHHTPVRVAASNRSGTLIASAGDDHAVRLWRVELDQRDARTWRGIANRGPFALIHGALLESSIARRLGGPSDETIPSMSGASPDDDPGAPCDEPEDPHAAFPP
jgi:WD40 repeat protein